ncbi:hypothetical protein PU629_12415 [Pullulanibacillus sp. KACC 23026]|uniref:hypothetical protein n=1 Tax=Pullulanibacillus sp. KACC 23026 TaxID=3028315 RepID=UPI0023B0C3B2|nr:hypothetical protein [Pullulanibacillus sp. KACC 23026]WEG10980.1 hypothetical protein PU629_12415 [Pullulanibacillus sp. KACC 23026]
MWLLVISAFLLPGIVWLMPKKIPRLYLYATTGVATYFQLLTDVFLHIELNWYGYFNPVPRSEWQTLWLVPIYFSIDPIFLNFYPYKKGMKRQILYMIGWSLFSTAYEWLASQLGIFYHNKWKLYDSAIAYPFLFLLLRLQLWLVMKLSEKDLVLKNGN